MASPILIDDEGKIFSAVAEGPVSGASWMLAGSYTSTVTSLASSQYAYSKIKVQNGGSAANCVGLALYAAASGSTVAVLRRGTAILPTNGNVNAGRTVTATEANGDGAVGPSTTASQLIGRALTEAASGGFTIVNFSL